MQRGQGSSSLIGAQMRGPTRKSTMTTNPAGNPKLLIAVDFGTTFSGVAYASTLEPDTQNTVDDWGEGPQGEKVPSVLKYENDDINRAFQWGFQAVRRRQPGEKVHEWFKLGLDPDIQASHVESELLQLYPNTMALPPVRPRRCEKLVVDYLKSLKEATDKYFTKKLTREMLELQQEYIITVPAMWSEAAQEATKACAAEAFLGDRHKIDNIRIIAEPEAAGIYALAKMPQLGLEKGHTFVICDAGGGTVDLSSYRINSFSPGHIDLEGRSIPSGGLYGSSFLNRIFADYLLNHKLRGYINPSKQAHMKWLKSAVDQDFERTIKPEFAGELDRTYYIDAFCFTTDSPQHGVRNSSVELTGREIVQNVFDHVVPKICHLVLKHMIDRTRDPVKAVLLAGGFGENRYLHEQIQQAVGTQVEVRRIDDSATAIVRGALVSGLSRVQQQTSGTSQLGNLNPSGLLISGGLVGRRPEDPGRIHPRVRFVTVSSRRSPKHYGVRVFEDYDGTSELHWRGRDKKVPGQPGMPDSIEVMKWFVKKDERIKEGDPKPFELYYDKEATSRPPTIKCPVYASNAEKPPDFPDDAGKPLLTLDIDLSELPESDLPKKRVNNRTYYHVDFEIYMTMRSADFEFVLARGNKRYKPQRVKFSRVYSDEE